MIKHLACIMDGNRRWAKKQALMLKVGGKQGLEKIRMAVQFCLKRNISYLSLYTFSIENLHRSAFERDCYFGLLLEHGKEYAQEMAMHNVRVRFVGDRSLMPDHLIAMCEFIEKTTEHGTALQLQLLFCYGGRQEIISGIKKICTDIQEGRCDIENIDENVLRKNMWMSGIPDPELIVRTGFANRLSNFLLFYVAYSELYFANCLWPEITEEELEKACNYFEECKRNFGK